MKISQSIIINNRNGYIKEKLGGVIIAAPIRHKKPHAIAWGVIFLIAKYKLNQQ